MVSPLHQNEISFLQSSHNLYRMKTNKIMSQVKGRFKSFERNKFNVNVVEYLFKRNINGCQNETKLFTKKLFDTARDLYKKDLIAHFGCVNAIEFSNDGNLLFSGGDDRRVLMWNVNEAMMCYTGKMGDGAKPIIMKGCHYSNIFCLAVDDENKRILSGSNDDRVIVHDYATGSPRDVVLHDSPVFSLSLHPNNGNIFASAADNGRILIYDIREPNADLLCVAKLRTPFHGVMFNPCEPSLIATANSRVGVHIWDLRKPKEILLKCSDEHSMSVRWNRSGTLLLALRNLLPVVVYDPMVPKKKLEFDASAYFNACTMKSCSFAGDNDEYILSGSDDFNLYVWKIPEPWPENKWVGSEHLTLSGHRSIVNQVRYNSSKQLIATSGVEKIIKLWCPFRMPYSEGDHDKPSQTQHRVLCSSRSCTRSPGFLSHDYSQESVDEDTRMIHFFDSLLRNELDDLTFLSQAYYLDANLFTLPIRKKETKAYEKLIRTKKKHLSKILLQKSDDNKSVCSLSQSSNVRRNKSPLHAESGHYLSGSEDESNCDDCFDASQSLLENSSAETSTDCPTSSSSLGQTSFSPSFSSTSSTSNVGSSLHSSNDSHLGSELSTFDLASSCSRSKASLDLNFSDSDESISNGSNDSKSGQSKCNNFKDSGVTLSDNSSSEHLEPCVTFKRKRLSGSRCYRSFTKKRRKNSSGSSCSDSESIGDENKLNGKTENDVNTSEGSSSSIADPKLNNINNESCSVAETRDESSTSDENRNVVDFTRYNMNTDFPIIYQIINKNHRSSYFGMSVVIRPKAAVFNNSWSIQIGAPRQNIDGVNSREPGAVFRCHTFGPCEIFLIDKNLTDFGGKGNYMFKEKKDGAFTGVSMDIKAFNKYERSVVCGNRWINQNLKNSENIDVTYLMTGVCYLQDIFGETMETSVQRLLPLVNADKIYTPKPYVVDLSTYHWGLGQAGTSVQLLEEPPSMIIGAPGVTHWVGSVVWYELDFKMIVANFAKTEISRKNRYTYIGYSVTAGRFYNDKKLWFATGAPRSGNYHGEVFTFRYKDHTDTIIVHSSISGSTFGEYFGSSLITSDLNEDGFDDLIVGAPLYSDKEPDEGRIYVYLGSDRGNLLLQSQVIDGKIRKGRFGTCLAPLKDLDQDGFNDVAIGAPYENDQKGAVYIYRGFSLGLQTEYAQIIRAQDVFPYLRGFGISISPAVDIDGNKYRDIAVGSFLSNHVVLFRSQPLISLYPKIKTQDNFYIDRKATFFNVSLCSIYTGSNAPLYADVMRIVDIDPIHKRASLQNSRSTSHEKLIRLRSNEISCEILTIYLDLSAKNFSPLQITLKNEVSSCLKTKRKPLLVGKLKLREADGFLKWCPAGKKAETSREIVFAGICGVDNVCRSELKLSCDIPEFRTGFYIIGSSEYFVLSVHLKNLGEPAYNTKIKIWSNTKLIHHDYKFDGLSETPRNTYWFDIEGTVAEHYQNNFSFKIALDTLKEIIPPESLETNLVLVVEVFTSTIDINEENRKFRFSVKLLSDAVVNLYYSSSLTSFFVSDKTLSLKRNRLLNITHYYEVQKKGVTPIKDAELTIYIPSYLGEEFFSVEIETANWMHISTNYQELGNKGSAHYTGTYANSYNGALEVDDKLSNRILFLNCSEMGNRCQVLRIFFTGDIPVGVSSYAKLIISLNTSTIDSIKGEKNIVLLATSSVLRYSQILESEPKQLQGSASTSLYWENMSKSVSGFVIFMSFILGGLLFSLILAGLIKSEFFKRIKKQQLKALKEAESNFIYFATRKDCVNPHLKE